MKLEQADEVLMEQFVSDLDPGEFVPFAYFDKHLDCIRVCLKDCSVIEERLNRFFTIMKPAHPDRHAKVNVAGLSIKGVRLILEELGYASETKVIALTDLINKMLRVHPEESTMKIQELFGPLVKDIKVEVDLEEAA